MWIKVFMLALCCTPFSPTLHGGLLERVFHRKERTAPPIIKVLIANDRSGVMLEVKGKYHVYDPRDNSFISTRFLGKRKYIQALKDGLKWGEAFPGVHQLMIVPNDQTVTTLVDGIEYRGSICVYDVEGRVSVVNEVFVEDYLMSTLTPCVQAGLPEEVLAALAITARTTADYSVKHPMTPYWNVDGQANQYQGYAAIELDTSLEKAIQTSRHLVMTTGEGQDASTFPAQWFKDKETPDGEGRISRVSLEEAVKMANKGANAADILARAFPGSRLQLTYVEVI